MTEQLNQAINHFGFWSVIVVIATSFLAMVLPLDVPDGYAAEHTDRVAWLSANRGAFIAGWVNQIVAMFSLSAVFACGAWHVASKNPLRAILAAAVVLMSVVAFVIPKFIAVWTLPMLADTIAAGSAGAEMAANLSVSPSTIRNHTQKILLKLHVHSRLEAVSLGRKLGFI